MRNLMLTLVLILAAVVPVLAQATDPVAVLESGAPDIEKMAALRALARQGGPETVPTLAALLLDEKFSHMARYALEPMPCTEAGDALRDALAKTSGKLKVGVIHSLGMREDMQAQPALIALLSDADAEVSQASAGALGRLGTPEAAKALADALAKPDLPTRTLWAFCDGLFDCAEAALAQGQSETAAAMYDQLRAVANAPEQVRTGAVRGAVLARGGESGVPLLIEALGSEDGALWIGALRVARELEASEAVTAALAAELANLPDEKKIGLIQVLGQRGGETAGPALMAQAKEGAIEVRVAAVNALVRAGYAPALELMEELAASDQSALAEAAKNGLSYFPGRDADAALTAMLANKDVGVRKVAIDLIRQGGLRAPVGPLMKAADGDSDESVRVDALEAVKPYASLNEMPVLLALLVKAKSDAEMQAAEKAIEALSERQARTPSGNIVVQKAVYGALPDGPSADVTEKVIQMVASGAMTVGASNANFGDPAPDIVKQLRVDFTENGRARSDAVPENQTLTLTTTSAPPAIVDALCAALGNASPEAKTSLIRLLRTAGSPKALEAVLAIAATGEGPVKDTATRALCEWPTPDAVPALMELVKSSGDQKVKVLALRGAVRLLKHSAAESADLVGTYSQLMDSTATADEKKAVLSGLAQVPDADAMGAVLAQSTDEAVKAEALQAAVTIANALGANAREDASLFNGQDLTGWVATSDRWRVEDGALVGQNETPLDRTEYLWASPTVRDFYLCVSVKLEPNTGNSGVQFRSEMRGDNNDAFGNQADIGQDVWGRIYDQGGRGKLDWNDRAEAAVKPEDWNRYEILVVGPAIWTAINGQLGVACLDLSSENEREGLIGIQLHAGAPKKFSYRFEKLIHDPKIELVGLNAEQLINELNVPTPQ